MLAHAFTSSDHLRKITSLPKQKVLNETNAWKYI